MPEIDATSAPLRAESDSAPDAPAARYRSGTAARLAGLPVATLRVWERRYRVVAPPLTGSGHRLYSPQDVQRLSLLKRLVDTGHSIGTLAGLASGELQRLLPQTGEPGRIATRDPARLVVIGEGLAARLDLGPRRGGGLPSGLPAALPSASPSGPPSAPSSGPPSGPPSAPPSASVDAPTGHDGARRAQAPWHTRRDYRDLAAAEQDSGPVPAADRVLIQLVSLQPDDAARVLVLARRWPAARLIVVYGFGPEHAAETLRGAGAVLWRGGLTARELAALLAPEGAPAEGAASTAQSPETPSPAPPTAPPRRYDDATLAAMAAISATIACECPRHVAELLMLLSQFEQYSAECLNRHPADAALHAYLSRMAGSARALFESALEHVAQAEGIDLRSVGGDGR